MPKEGEIVRECLCVLWEHGIRAFRQNTGSINLGDRYIKMAVKGCPDIVGWIPGENARFIGVECKVPGRKATEEQQKFLDMLNADGGLGVVVHSADQLEQYIRMNTDAPPPSGNPD